MIGPVTSPLELPYKSSSFTSRVHFSGIWSVHSTVADLPFSEPGDSGSLIVTEDGRHAIGLHFAGNGPVGFMMPIDGVLAAFGGASLVGGLNV